MCHALSRRPLPMRAGRRGGRLPPAQVQQADVRDLRRYLGRRVHKAMIKPSKTNVGLRPVWFGLFLLRLRMARASLLGIKRATDSRATVASRPAVFPVSRR